MTTRADLMGLLTMIRIFLNDDELDIKDIKITAVVRGQPSSELVLTLPADTPRAFDITTKTREGRILANLISAWLVHVIKERNIADGTPFQNESQKGGSAAPQGNSGNRTSAQGSNAA